MSADPERPPDEGEGGLDAPMRAAILSVLACGICLAVAGLAFFGARAGLGAAIGGALATANLWVLARMGRALVARKGRAAPWGLVAFFKLLALFGGVWLILASGVVSALSLAAGYAALPIGIVLASLFGPRPPEDDRDGTP
jgi:hypothetical protein